jgi:signal transduction histidine kinase
MRARGSKGEASVVDDLAGIEALRAELARLRESSERDRCRAQMMQALTMALAPALTVRQIAEAVVQALRALHVRGSNVYVRDGDAEMRLAASSGFDDASVRPFLGIRVAGNTPNAKAYRTGQPVWLETPEELDAQFSSLTSVRRATGDAAWASLPIVAASGLLGVMGLSFDEPHAFDEAEKGFLLSVAAQVAQALERARLFEAEREAQAFQQRLIGIVSHDLRTPLTTLALGADRLRQLLDPNGGERRVLDRMVFATRQMTRLVGDLADYTQARARGGLPVQLAPAEFGAVCFHVLEQLRTAHPSRELRYQAGAAVAVGAWDAARIEQLLDNLVGNAFKYGADGAPVTVSWQLEVDAVLLAVHNAGAPIATDLLTTIFDPFRRGQHDGTEQNLGLGLFIARQIAIAHGGSIDVRSTAEDGTRFMVRLPLDARPGISRSA